MYVNNHAGVMKSKYPPSQPPLVIPNRSGMLCMYTVCLKRLLYSYIYVWTINDGAFWMYPTSYTSYNILSGYMWDRNVWRFSRLDCSQIEGVF